MKKATHDENIPKVVGVWIRVSTDDQAKGESPEHHLQRARYYAEAKGWKIKEVYHLEGVSGVSVTDHPETKRMLTDRKLLFWGCRVWGEGVNLWPGRKRRVWRGAGRGRVGSGD